ncbi:unnamed protein product, partial [Polarella glacialis]
VRLGIVRAVEGGRAEVEFSTPRAAENEDAPKEPSASLPLALLTPASHLAVARARPGSRVCWSEEEGGDSQGVVCSSDSTATLGPEALLFGMDGRQRRLPLQRLREKVPKESREGQPFDIGVLVQLCCYPSVSEGGSTGGCYQGVALGSIGMVVRVVGESSLVVRFPDDREEQSVVDLAFDSSLASRCLVEAANQVRPGAAVRLRVSGSQLPVAEEPDIGIVFALHGDAMAVVDFFGNWGCRCSVAELEVVEDPPAAEFAALRLVSECLAWHETAVGHWERRHEELASILRRVSPMGTLRDPSQGFWRPPAAGSCDAGPTRQPRAGAVDLPFDMGLCS